MKKYYNIFLIAFLLFTIGTNAFAQNEEKKQVAPPPAVRQGDYKPSKDADYFEEDEEEEDVVVTSQSKNNTLNKKKYELRKFDTAKINAWKRDPAFQYDTEKIKWVSSTKTSSTTDGSRSRPYEYGPLSTEGNSGSSSSGGSDGAYRPPPPQQDPNKKGGSGSSSTDKPPPPPPPIRSSTSSPDLSWLLWVLGAIAVGVIGYVIYTQLNKPKYNKNYSGQKITEDGTDNIHNIKYPTELEKAIANKNYRLAIKLMYLEQLKMLDTKKMIDWKINKTNWDYLGEIQDPTIANNYKASSFIFDSAWYGELPLTDDSFNKIHQAFNNYKQPLS